MIIVDLKEIIVKKEKQMSMFCYQCQEAAKGTGCDIVGVCGKNESVANLQDLMVWLLKGISFYSTKAKEGEIDEKEVNIFVANVLFVTITNANFDEAKHVEYIKSAIALRDKLASQVSVDGNKPECATWIGEESEFAAKSAKVGVLTTENEDVRSLRELLIYGLKGGAAYYIHANNLGQDSPEVGKFMQEALASTLNDDLTVDELVKWVLDCGKFGVDAMALLDGANTGAYGNPEITEVNIGVGDKPGILISGHDLKDIQLLLEQTEGTGVDVYTHSEMLPAHYYPAFKKYKHFVGNYGGAWHTQDKEFATFNGPILFTTNCIVPSIAKSDYADRIYTTNAAGLTGAVHIDEDENGNKDFSVIIEQAKGCKAPIEIETGKIIGGFAHNQVISLADQVIDAVKSGAIKKFVVMAGCDGRQKGRSYYTDFAKALPNDSIILTAGCAKFRYNKLGLGDIGGIPRVLDAGQCNDSYSLVKIALALKDAFGLESVNDLPLAYNIAWYEQKAVIVLLALLHLGVKNIHLGPTLPAFLSPNVVNVLVENFGVAGIDTVDNDIENLILA